MFYLLYFLGKPGKKFFVLIAVPLRRGPEKRYYDLISLLAGEGGKDLPSRKTNFISYFFPTAIKPEGGLRVIKKKKKKIAASHSGISGNIYGVKRRSYQGR